MENVVKLSDLKTISCNSIGEAEAYLKENNLTYDYKSASTSEVVWWIDYHIYTMPNRKVACFASKEKKLYVYGG